MPESLQSGASPVRALSRWLRGIKTKSKTEQVLDPRAEAVKRTINELTRAKRIKAAIALGFAATALTATVANGVHVSAENNRLSTELSQIESQSNPTQDGSVVDSKYGSVTYEQSAEQIPDFLALCGLIGGSVVTVLTIAFNEGDEKRRSAVKVANKEIYKITKRAA